MWVLTFEASLQGAAGRAVAMGEVASFAERLTARFGHKPYWYSPELHPNGHGWHVNFFVGRRIKHHLVQDLWGNGIVWVKDWTEDSRIKPLGLPVVAAVRLGAVYGCKYAAKDWGEDVLVGGAHRYEVAEDFQPDELVERKGSLAEAMASVRGCFGGAHPESSWSSNDSPGWHGPPLYTLTFTQGLSTRRPGA